MADVEVIDLTNLADDDEICRPPKRQRRSNVKQAKNEQQQYEPGTARTGPILPVAGANDLMGAEHPNGRTHGANGPSLYAEAKVTSLNGTGASHGAHLPPQAGPGSTPAPVGAEVLPFTAVASGGTSLPKSNAKPNARGGQAPPGPKAFQAASPAPTSSRPHASSGPGPSTSSGTPRGKIQLSIRNFTTPEQNPGSGPREGIDRSAHNHPRAAAEQRQGPSDHAQAPQPPPQPHRHRRHHDRPQPQPEPEARAQARSAAQQPPGSRHPRPQGVQHQHPQAPKPQPPTQLRPQQPPQSQSEHQRGPQPQPQPQRPPQEQQQPHQQPQAQPQHQYQGQQRPGGRASRPDRLERQSTLDLLYKQDQQLVAQRDALAGVDLASSLRFMALVQAHNDTLKLIKDAPTAALDAGQHQLLSDVALLASRRLERLGARTPMDFVNALLAVYGREQEANAGGAGSSGGGGGCGVARDDHDEAEERARARGGEVQWRRLGRDVARCFHPARGPSVMLGPMHKPPKARREAAQRRKPEPVAPAVRPKEYTAEEAGIGQVDSFTSHIMDDMIVRIRGLRPSPSSPTASQDRVTTRHGLRLPAAAFRALVEVIFDPAGFAQTIENLHALSHLMVQGWLTVRLNERQQLMVAALTTDEYSALKRTRARGKAGAQARTEAAAGGRAGGSSGGAAGPSNPDAVDGGGGGGSTSSAQPVHFFLPMELEDWRRMCREVPQQRCLMPSRVYKDEDDAGARWVRAAAGGPPAGDADEGEAGGSAAGGGGLEIRS